MIETRKSEIRYTTSDPSKMLGRFLAKNVYKTWTEDFIDESTGEIVSINRNELLFNAGDYIDQNLLVRIRFSMQADDVKEVEVTNQRRMAHEAEYTFLRPYMAKVIIKDKNCNIMLHATEIRQVMDILTDYVELNYNGWFEILQVKRFDIGTVIEDKLVELKQDNPADTEQGTESTDTPEESRQKKYYQIAARISIDGEELPDTQTVIVHTFTADRAMMLINAYLKTREHEKAEKIRQDINPDYIEQEIIASIEESKIISISAYIPREFSEAYNGKEDAQ